MGMSQALRIGMLRFCVFLVAISMRYTACSPARIVVMLESGDFRINRVEIPPFWGGTRVAPGLNSVAAGPRVFIAFRSPEGPIILHMRLVRDDDMALEDEPIADETTARVGEPADGAVDAAEEELDESSSADLPPVNLPLLEALLFSTHHPLTAGRLAELIELESTKPVRKAIQELNSQYESTGRCFRVEQVAGGYQLLTLPEFGEALRLLHQKEIDAKLTKAALETLAIIAYKQPILRADIEAIRGVACGETIRSLMEKAPRSRSPAAARRNYRPADPLRHDQALP